MGKHTEELIQILEKTFSDKKFSNSEKKAIKEIISETNLNNHNSDFIQSRIFDIAKSEIKGYQNIEIIDWIEAASKVLKNKNDAEIIEKVYFSPGEDCKNAIINLLNNATSNIDICVFTISDNDISDKIIECHKRGINVRVITDDDKTTDRGSDINTIKQAGIKVEIDCTPHHMHHKFAVVDNKFAITGSYNWTRSAHAYNFENILVTNNKSVVSQFHNEFKKLWNKMTRM